MAWKLRRINAEQSNARAGAMKRVAVGDVWASAFECGARCLTISALRQPQATGSRARGCKNGRGHNPAAGAVNSIQDQDDTP